MFNTQQTVTNNRNLLPTISTAMAFRSTTQAYRPVTKANVTTKRKYEPLETDGPATCLVWFD